MGPGSPAVDRNVLAVPAAKRGVNESQAGRRRRWLPRILWPKRRREQSRVDCIGVPPKLIEKSQGAIEQRVIDVATQAVLVASQQTRHDAYHCEQGCAQTYHR